MASSINPGILATGKLLVARAATRKNLSTDLKFGTKNVFDYSDAAISDGSTDARAAIALADATGPVYFPPGTYAITANYTFTNKPEFEVGAKLKAANRGVTITLNDGFKAELDQHVFDISGHTAATFTASGATLTSSAHGMANGQRVRVTTSGTLPGGLDLFRSYYIVSTATNTFGLSLTSGGTAITTSSAGSGTHSVRPETPVFVPNGDVLTPDHFGAARDSVTDDTLAINAALVAGQANHINVKFLQGYYVGDGFVDMSIGNMRVTISGKNTWLKAATTNRFALTLTTGTTGALIGPMVITGFTFDGTDKSKHGLQIATYFLATVENCHARNCGIGMLVNGTIDNSLYDINFIGCYVGLYFTIRSTAQHGRTITDIAGQTVACAETPSLGQPTEQLISRADFNQCVVAMVVDQRGNIYSHQQCILMNKPHIENCIAGIWIKGDQANPNSNPNQIVTINNLWPEGIGNGSTLHTDNGGAYGSNVTVDGDTEEFGFVMLWGGQVVVRDCGLGKAVVRNRATLITENCTTVSASVVDTSASIVSRNGLIAGEFQPFLNDYAFPGGSNQGFQAGFRCLPFSGISYEYADSADLLHSKINYGGDSTLNNTGESYPIDDDGIFEQGGSTGHIVRQSSGIYIDGIVTDQTSFYCTKFAIKADSPIATFTASGTTFTSAGHAFVVGQEMRLTTTGTLPTGVTTGTSYYIKTVATNTFELAATPTGSAISVSGGSGTHSIQQHDFTLVVNNLDNGYFMKGSLPVTKDWRTWFAVGTAKSGATNGNALFISNIANVVRKVAFGPCNVFRVDNDAKAMELCRSQAFFASSSTPKTITAKDRAEAVASSSTPTFDYSDMAGDTKTHTATSLVTPTITMARPGRHDLVITQDATGGREILWPTNMKFRYTPPQPDTTPGKKSLLSWVYDGTHGVADGVNDGNNYVADFDAVDANGAFPTIAFPDAGTILMKVRLTDATPAAKTILYQTKNTGTSHYPYLDGLIYCDWLRTTRVDGLTSLVNLEQWHWVIVRTDSTDGWSLQQATLDGTLYGVATATHETLGSMTTGFIGGASGVCQAEVDRIFFFNSRLSSANNQGVIASTKASANSALPSGLLARYEMNYDRGTKLIQDWSGNGKDIPLTSVTPSLFVVNSGTNTLPTVEDLGSLGTGTQVFNFNNGNGIHKKVVATGSIALQFVATIPGYYTALVEIDTAGGPLITYATTVEGTVPTVDTSDNSLNIIPLFYDGVTWYHV